ncbi:hypothetical protein [Streptomyces sp. NPDC048157]|uniref:hypothetical protein n=1 Tax=Streptomyces sp. NPDC048157 TaxID=3365503 RepID=UPI0037191ABC
MTAMPPTATGAAPPPVPGGAAGPPPDRIFHLHDRALPPVEAGSYTITVSQHLDGPGRAVHAPPPPYEQAFTVCGPRYAIDPQLVTGVYPRAGTEGDVRDVLPHLALSVSTLPWTRPIDAAHTKQAEIPWLALLTFAEGDLAVDPGTGQTVSTRTIDSTGVHSEDKTVLCPTLMAEPLPAGTTTCRTIDVPAEQFTALTPRLAELRHLTHVKRVDPVISWSGRNAGDLGIEEPEAAEVAVLLSNRLPRTPSGKDTAFSVHLVSVEGLADALEGPLPVGIEHVRMISLYTWTFTGQQQGTHPDFADEAESLKQGSGADLLLRAQARTATTDRAGRNQGADPAGGRLKEGYVPLAHHLPTGERTLAWYRGPWTPVIPNLAPYPETGPATEADALVYLPEQGMFDISHASAFALGRTFALSAGDLPTRLGRMRGEGLLLAQEITAAGGPDAAASLVSLLETAAQGHTPPVPGGVLNRLRARHRIYDEFEECLGNPAPSTRGSDPAGRAAPRAGLRAVVEAPASSPAGRLLDMLVEDHLGPLRRAGLDHTTLLAAVPFDHLVAHPALLPPNSIRFFAVDRQWLQVMAAGAASLGLSTTLDTRLTARLLTRLHQDADLPPRGALIRSPLVRDWPALTVTATDPYGGDVLYEPPRRLTADLMLLTFSSAPHTLTLREPTEGIHFGLDGDHAIGLRRLKASAAGAQDGTGGVGESLESSVDVSGCLRHPALGVLNVWDGTASCLSHTLRTALADYRDPQWDKGTELTSAALALQLLNSPHQLVLTATGTSGADRTADPRETPR